MDIGAAAKKPIQDYLDMIQPPPPKDGSPPPAPSITRDNLECGVAFVKVEKCKEEGKVKLLLSAPQWAMREPIRAALAAASVGDNEVRHARGVGPAGWMEDELGTWLEALL